MTQLGDSSLELGDTCIAAPFTFKFTSLKSVNSLIRESLKTLKTTFKMYKILSLNSFIQLELIIISFDQLQVIINFTADMGKELVHSRNLLPLACSAQRAMGVTEYSMNDYYQPDAAVG